VASTMTTQLKVLVVDDEESIRELLQESLSLWGYAVSTACDGVEALGLIRSHLFDAALLDIRMPRMDGLELLREIRRRNVAIPVVVMTGVPSVSTAVEALQQGAYDYLQKPLVLEVVRHLMARLTERRQLNRVVQVLRSRLDGEMPERELVGVSPAMTEIRAIVAKVAATDSPVLIEGESGTGKEVVAATIHRRSARSTGPFIPVNCGAIPGDLLESEFFGHVRGAFSGAVADALGLFRSAHGGTLFLDEVAELPPALQVKLLRVLQEREVRPVGSTKTYTIDVRVIAATNRPLEEALRNGALRRDLYYRLNVVRIVVPPLRERKRDIAPLVSAFLRQFNQRFGRDVTGVSPEALAAFQAYDFPGNIRELENLLERAYALGVKTEITLADLPALSPRVPASLSPTDVPTLAQVERELILRALDVYGNDRDQAARALGISRRTIYRRLKEYGVL
jgi:two-component system, NtrC family, response regulator AtoC